MIKRLLTGATAALMLLTGAALVQPANCATRDAIVERLASSYGETRQSMGLGANNAVIEVFASDKSGSWTITVTGTNGITCLVASGQAFDAMAESLPALSNDA